MDKREASAVSGLMMDFWHAELAGDGTPSRHHIVERADKTTYHAALDLLPAGAIAALIQMGDENTPTIIAVKGQQLYLLSLENVPDEDADPYVNLFYMHIEGGSGTVELKQSSETSTTKDRPHGTTNGASGWRTAPRLRFPTATDLTSAPTCASQSLGPLRKRSATTFPPRSPNPW